MCHTVSQKGHITCNYWTTVFQYACITDQVLTFMTVVLDYRIISLKYCFLKMSADGHLGFSPFLAKRDIGFIPKVNKYCIY